MSLAALVRDGLPYFVTLLTVLLVMFIYATIRAAPETVRPVSQPEDEPLVPSWPEQDDATLGWPPRQASWPGEAADETAEAGPLVRRATRGGPPWGPAPRPPGLAP
jgi:hypothetical protein